jgi:hypothetical protein
MSNNQSLTTAHIRLGGCPVVRLRHIRAETDDVHHRWLSGWLSVGGSQPKAWLGSKTHTSQRFL